MGKNIATPRAGGITKAQASALFAQGERIRVRTADGSHWRIVDFKNGRTLHDAILASGWHSIGLDNTARLSAVYIHEPHKVEKPKPTTSASKPKPKVEKPMVEVPEPPKPAVMEAPKVADTIVPVLQPNSETDFFEIPEFLKRPKPKK